MSDELERMLRRSLRNRADDVEPTPYLFEEVRGRVRRRRWTVRLAAAVGFGVAAVLAIVVVPGALDLLRPTETDVDILEAPEDREPDGPTGTEGDDDAGPGTDPEAAAIPGYAVATDGRSIVLIDLAAAQDPDAPVAPEELYSLPEEGEARFVTVAVRPGSTRQDLVAALLVEAEGMYEHRWLEVRDGEVAVHSVPEPYAIVERGVDGPVPAPVWSPDGRHLAWIETGDAGPMLRFIGWLEGPGTGRTADDNASFEILTDSGYTHDEPLQLESWTWTEETLEAAEGWMAFSDGSPDVYTLVVQRQPDGAIALPAVPSIEQAVTEQVTLDLDHGAGPFLRVFVLSVAGAGEGSVELRLETEIDGEGLELPTPAELSRTNDPSSIWLESVGGGALLGGGGEAWLITLDGGVHRLPGPVWYADALR